MLIRVPEDCFGLSFSFLIVIEKQPNVPVFFLQLLFQDENGIIVIKNRLWIFGCGVLAGVVHLDSFYFFAVGLGFARIEKYFFCLLFILCVI